MLTGGIKMLSAENVATIVDSFRDENFPRFSHSGKLTQHGITKNKRKKSSKSRNGSDSNSDVIADKEIKDHTKQ